MKPEFIALGLILAGALYFFWNITRYEEQLRQCFDDRGRLLRRIAFGRHNDVSAAISIRYGRARVILCGDVEVNNWTDVEAHIAKERLKANGIKVSHHGSTNGYTETLWARFAAAEKPCAIVTPFRRVGLPEIDAIKHIRANTQVLMTTCAPETLPAKEHDFRFTRPRDLDTTSVLRGTFEGWIDDEETTDRCLCSMHFKNDGSWSHSYSAQAGQLK
jgi:hypothetical protein